MHLEVFPPAPQSPAFLECAQSCAHPGFLERGKQSPLTDAHTAQKWQRSYVRLSWPASIRHNPKLRGESGKYVLGCRGRTHGPSKASALSRVGFSNCKVQGAHSWLELARPSPLSLSAYLPAPFEQLSNPGSHWQQSARSRSLSVRHQQRAIPTIDPRHVFPSEATAFLWSHSGVR